MRSSVTRCSSRQRRATGSMRRQERRSIRTKATFPTFVQDLVGTKWFNANLRSSAGNPFTLSEFSYQDIWRAPDSKWLCPPGSEGSNRNGWGVHWRRCDTCTTAPLQSTSRETAVGFDSDSARAAGLRARSTRRAIRFSLAQGALPSPHRAAEGRAWLRTPTLT